MRAKDWLNEFLRLNRSVESAQNKLQPGGMSRLDASLRSSLVEQLESLVAEAYDHQADCIA